MARLSLDDPKWASLDQRNGAAEWVPGRLRHLLAHPEDGEAFSDLWPHLSSEGSSYSAGHAALPYILDVAERLPAGRRLEHLAFVGVLVACTESLEPTLRVEYEASLPRALRLVAEELPFPHAAADTRYLIAAAAALKGYPKIANTIQALESLTECPECHAALDEIEG